MTDTPTSKDRHFGGSSTTDLPVDREELRVEVQVKYAEVALQPQIDFHFHTGHVVAERFGYDMDRVATLPDAAVESFAGVANPFALRDLQPGEKVVDLGSGAGFDSFMAASVVGDDGQVIGVDMTDAMLTKSRATAAELGNKNVEFRHGYLEDIPVADGWADVVIANGVFNLCPDKVEAFTETWRIMRSGGVLQFADIANSAEVPDEAKRHIDLWTG